MVDHGEVSIADYARDVWDQGSDPICHCVAVSDMMTIIFRLLGLKYVKLSPKILIDAWCLNVKETKKIICNPELGLQSICDYQFMFPRTVQGKIEYEEGNRYWIDRLIEHVFPQQILDVIRHNYSELGRKFPLLAIVVMGAFARPDIALDAFETPFRHNLSDEDYAELLEKEDPHCLVIVGANFSSEDKSKHYCLVKNSYSDDWGHDGFSKIALEMVLRLDEPVMSEENIAHVTWNEKRTWAEGTITVSERSGVSGQHDTRIFDQDTMKSSSLIHPLLEVISIKMKRILLVSNLRLQTRKSEIFDYFTGTFGVEITDIVLNSWENGYYNKSCLVTFSTREDAKRVRKTRNHHIGGVKVTVKRYRGKEGHPKVFQRGEHDLFIKGTNEVSILHRLFEDICLKCGRESGINFLRSEEDGEYNGEVVITFYNESQRQMALDIVTGEYNLEAYPLKSADQVNQD